MSMNGKHEEQQQGNVIINEKKAPVAQVCHM